MRERMSQTTEINNEDNVYQIPVWKKLAITKEEAAEYSHIGINKLEELLKLPNCPFVLYVGKKKLIKRKEFEQFISEMVEL